MASPLLARRNAAMDGVRGAALLFVVSTHLRNPGQAHGYLALEAFFALSGYLITRQLTKDSQLTAFYGNRVRRLLPALAVAVLGVFLLRGFLPHDARPTNGMWVIAPLNLTAWFAWLGVGFPGALYHLWSLSVEEAFYFVWPVVIVLAKKRDDWRPKLAVACVAVAVGDAVLGFLVCGAPARGDLPAAYFAPPLRLTSILVGAAVALSLGSEGRCWRAFVAASRQSWLPLVLLAVALLSEHRFVAHSFLVAVPCTALATVLVVHAESTATTALTWAGRVLRLKPLQMLGVASYSIYLWHYPVIAMTQPWRDHLSQRFYAPLAALTFMVPSLLSFWFLERPHLLRSLSRRNTPV